MEYLELDNAIADFCRPIWKEARDKGVEIDFIGPQDSISLELRLTLAEALRVNDLIKETA